MVERQVVVGSRAGGLLKGHAAAGWLMLEARVIRSEVAAHRLVWPFYAARLLKCRQPSRHGRGPLQAFVAPLAAGELVEMGAAAAFSAWPPALRAPWHTWRQFGGSLEACCQLTMACS